MIININDNSDSNYVFVQLFMDSMRKIAKKNVVESLRYTHPEGLIAKDINGTFWKINVNAELFFPNELIENSSVPDEDANGNFCIECLRGMSENSSKGLCKICEYVEKAGVSFSRSGLDSH
jgi:hypothetical protein